MGPLNTDSPHRSIMGIYDRDYMRQRETEPADTPRVIARKGLMLAICIVGGVLIFAAVIRRDAAEQEKVIRQQRAEEERMRSMLQWAAKAVREAPPLGNEIKSEPPPMLKRLLNVNTATVEELDEIPNVRSKTAESIFRNRPYKTMEDLDRAWGIDEPMIELLRPYLTVE